MVGLSFTDVNGTRWEPARRGARERTGQLSLIRDTYTRFRVLVHEVAKFGIVGAIGFVVQLGFQNVLHSGLGVGYLSALVAGYLVATAVTFVGNRYWAFKHRQGKGLGHESMLFVLLNAIAIGIQLAVVGFVVYGLGLKDTFSYNIATIFGIGFGTLMRFWSYRKFVFLEQPAEPPAAEQLQPEATGQF